MKDRQIIRVISSYHDLDLDELVENQVGIEIQDFTQPDLTQLEADRILAYYEKALKDFTGIRAMHGPFMDLKPASPDPDISRISRDKYVKTLEGARKLNMDYVIFHSQINPDLNDKLIRELNARQSAQAWREILDRVPDYKGIILIENVFEKDPSMLKELLDEINLSNVGLNLDIGHVNLGKENLKNWVSLLKDHLIYSHIHTNDGLHDQHRPIDRQALLEYFKILDHNGLKPMISLEYKLDSIESELGRLEL